MTLKIICADVSRQTVDNKLCNLTCTRWRNILRASGRFKVIEAYFGLYLLQNFGEGTPENRSPRRL